MRRFSLRRHGPLLVLAMRRPGRGLAVAWWWLTGRRVRALARLRAALTDGPMLYRHWLAIHQPSPAAPGARGAEPLLPVVAVHLHLPPGDDGAAAIASVLGQAHAGWTLHVTSAGACPALPDDPRIVGVPHCASRIAGLAQALGTARASHLVPLAAGMTLTPGALLAFARVLAGVDMAADPGAAAHGAGGPGAGGPGASDLAEIVLYADQDERHRRGRSDPWLKPAWDCDLFLAQDYVSAACALPTATAAAAARDLAAAAGTSDAVAVYAVIARLLPARLRHVPYIAVTTRAGAWRRACPERAGVVAALIGQPVRQGPFATLAPAWPLPAPPPLVSVIVPTRDRGDLLRTCVAGVLHGTRYPAIELIVADNDSREPAALAVMAECARDPRVRILRWPRPYNYSAINNFAAGHATGTYLCLLNNDIEVIDPAWLAELVAQAARPGAGAAGARLLYPDRSIQHAGVVIGMGGAAGHAHRGLADGAPGYFAQALVARQASAVTAACLVVARDSFMAVGGLDEAALGIAYNDVDLCLKLRAAGLRNLYVPQAVLIHHESKSRGSDFAPEHHARYLRELAVLQARWGTQDAVDACHHPELDPTSEQYRLRL